MPQSKVVRFFDRLRRIALRAYKLDEYTGGDEEQQKLKGHAILLGRCPKDEAIIIFDAGNLQKRLECFSDRGWPAAYRPIAILMPKDYGREYAPASLMISGYVQLDNSYERPVYFDREDNDVLFYAVYETRENVPRLTAS